MLSKKQRKQQDTLHQNYIMTKDVVGQLVKLVDQFKISHLQLGAMKTYKNITVYLT